MIVLIVHWKIRPDDRSVRQFLEKWHDMEPSRPSNFFAEYLSAPLPAEETGFPCTTFNVSSDVRYRSFFNVAIWRDVDSFNNDVLNTHVAGAPDIEPFEFDRRERMVLSPVDMHVGEYEPIHEH